jgi:hypothetical protein
MSIVIVVATPHIKDPMKNIPRDIRRASLRPKRLLILPQEGIDAAVARR